jgi:predicted transcriptional regulator
MDELDEDALDELVAEVRSSKLPAPAQRRRKRERAGVSIRRAAAVNGVAPMTFLRWERGKVQPRRSNAVRYRRFLDALDEAVES